jgi:hypothetical protein
VTEEDWIRERATVIKTLSYRTHLGPEDFAERLERAILRSGVKMPGTIDADAVALPQPE